VQALLAVGQLHVVTATSGEALQNLLMMIDEQYHQQLLAVPLVVISDRLKQIASEKGFKRIAVAKAPADAAIVDEVKTIIGEIG
jgi:uroporphyrinogen-III synthase